MHVHVHVHGCKKAAGDSHVRTCTCCRRRAGAGGGCTCWHRASHRAARLDSYHRPPPAFQVLRGVGSHVALGWWLGGRSSVRVRGWVVVVVVVVVGTLRGRAQCMQPTTATMACIGRSTVLMPPHACMIVYTGARSLRTCCCGFWASHVNHRWAARWPWLLPLRRLGKEPRRHKHHRHTLRPNPAPNPRFTAPTGALCASCLAPVLHVSPPRPCV